MSKSEDQSIPMSLSDRLTLLTVLPKEGDIITIRVVKDLRTDLAMSEDEIKEVGITQQNGTISWDRSKEKPKGIMMGSVRRGIIREILEKLNKEKRLTEQHLSIWDMFC